jgi:hypothetical protein
MIISIKSPLPGGARPAYRQAGVGNRNTTLLTNERRAIKHIAGN